MAKKVKRPAMASSLNPAGVWESTPAHLARGHAGEQSIGFYLGEAGYFIRVWLLWNDGPSGVEAALVLLDVEFPVAIKIP